MKKLSMLNKLMALLLIAALLPVSAMAAPGDAVIARSDDENFNDWINNRMILGDTLYLEGENAFYTYHIGDEDLTTYYPGENSYIEDLMANPDAVSTPEDEKTAIYYDKQATFAAAGNIYRLYTVTEYNAETSMCRENAILAKVVFEESSYTMELVSDAIDWSDMIMEYDEYSYSKYIQGFVDCGDELFFVVSDDYNHLYSLNISTLALTEHAGLEGVYNITSYEDGKLLVQLYDYSNATETTFLSYDPATRTSEVVAVLGIASYEPLNGIAYSQDTGLLYYAHQGMLKSLNLENHVVVEVTDLPVSVYSGETAMIMNGTHYVAGEYGGTVIRNIDPTLKAEVFLKVYNGSYTAAVENAYYTFINANPNATAVIYNDYMEDDKILENMMNRVDTPDIYVLYTETAAYDAIKNRGYIAEIESTKLNDMLKNMFPGMKDVAYTDGELVAIPVETSGYGSLSINKDALELLGIEFEDVPTDWSSFLDWLTVLPEYFPEDENISLFYADATAEYVREILFYCIFEEYLQYLDVVGREKGFNTPELRNLLEKLEKIDFVALGQAEQEPYDEEGNYIGAYINYGDQPMYTLMDTYSGVAPGNMGRYSYPVLLSFDENTPATVNISVVTAFINPFTKNYDAAVKFLEAVAEEIPETVKMTISSDYLQPLRYTYYEDSVAGALEWLDTITVMYEEASEEDKQYLAEELKYAEEYYQETLNEWWVSQEDIDWYLARSESIRARQSNPLYDTDDETAGELVNLIDQYLHGTMDVNNFLRQVDKKLQMILLEGN